MAILPFPFDTLRARRILTKTALSGSQAEAILDVIFMVVKKSMAHKGQISKGAFIARIVKMFVIFCGVVVALLKLSS